MRTWLHTGVIMKRIFGQNEITQLRGCKDVIPYCKAGRVDLALRSTTEAPGLFLQLKSIPTHCSNLEPLHLNDTMSAKETRII